jgi:hypothetical protein
MACFTQPKPTNAAFPQHQPLYTHTPVSGPDKSAVFHLKKQHFIGF